MSFNKTNKINKNDAGNIKTMFLRLGAKLKMTLQV